MKSVGTQTLSTYTDNKSNITKEIEINRKSKPKSKNKNKTDSEATNLTHSKSASNQTHNENPENQPRPKRVKKPKNSNVSPKQLTRKDFLKNRPITLEEDQPEDPLKCYVSPEEDMLTDSWSESDADASNTAPV
jgi:hypothetical protein